MMSLTDAGGSISAEHVSGVTEALEAALCVGTFAVVADGAVPALVQVGAEGGIRREGVPSGALAAVRAAHVHTATVQADPRVLHTLVHVCGGDTQIHVIQKRPAT